MSNQQPTPYRLAVFAHGFRRGRQYRRYTEIIPSDFGYIAWAPEQHYREARLPSAGSFLFPGLLAVRARAMQELASPSVYQVQVRTNQDRSAWLWNKRSDGHVSGYRPD